MQHIRVDIAENAHVAASRLEGGSPRDRAFRFANDERGFRSLLKRFAELEVDPDDCIIAVESAGRCRLALWSFPDDRGCPVASVNPVLTDALRKADLNLPCFR